MILLRQNASPIIKKAGTNPIPPTRFLKAFDIPKADWPQFLRPRLAPGKAELVTQVVLEIVAVIDDVRLMHRENGIPSQVRIVGDHAVLTNRYKLWRIIQKLSRYLQRIF
jgi:hypothetical protein